MLNAKLKFLLEAPSALASSSQTTKLLTSYYSSIARELFNCDNNSSIQLFERKNACSKCSTNWIDGNFELDVESNKINQRGRRMIATLELGQHLTRKQKARAKFYKKKQFSYIVFTCKLCSTKTKIPLEERNKSTTVTAKDDHTKDIEIESNSNKIKKKKNKRNEKEDLQSISETNKLTTKSLTKKDMNTKSNKVMESNKITRIDQSSSQKSSQTKKVSKLEPTSVNIKKSNNSKNLKKNIKSKPVVSKTQQKNTLLQLAQLLKQNSNKTNQNNDRLKNLLR